MIFHDFLEDTQGVSRRAFTTTISENTYKIFMKIGVCGLQVKEEILPLPIIAYITALLDSAYNSRKNFIFLELFSLKKMTDRDNIFEINYLLKHHVLNTFPPKEYVTFFQAFTSKSNF